MESCTHLHEKLIYEEQRLERVPDSERVDFILSRRGRRLCEYCLCECPDRKNCDKYKRDAR